ncbi:hypothetical protein DFH09DRAFT_1375537 [Mycena vulgaris]|nr:hypothetical protein DFH09DRAFT_1375537 [Mycena vulgaris]
MAEWAVLRAVFTMAAIATAEDWMQATRHPILPAATATEFPPEFFTGNWAQNQLTLEYLAWNRHDEGRLHILTQFIEGALSTQLPFKAKETLLKIGDFCEIIHNPETVDLLVSLMYSAAAEGVVDESFPIGMALRVPPPDKARVIATPIAGPYSHHCDYDGGL